MNNPKRPAGSPPEQRYNEECIQCHVASGGVLTLAGLYCLVGVRRGTDLLGQKGTWWSFSFHPSSICPTRVACATEKSDRCNSGGLVVVVVVVVVVPHISHIQRLARVRRQLLDLVRTVLCSAAMAQSLHAAQPPVRPPQEEQVGGSTSHGPLRKRAQDQFIVCPWPMPPFDTNECFLFAVVSSFLSHNEGMGGASLHLQDEPNETKGLDC